MTVISIDRAELLSRLREIARQIRSEHPEVADVRVFGSIARGDQVGTSDLDVLILLAEDGGQDPIERVMAFYPYFDLPIGVDILVYTEQELARRLESDDLAFHRVWRECRQVLPP